MGGKGGGKKKRQARPPEQAAPLDYMALMKAANEGASESARAQIQAQVEAYPELERLQLGTIQKIADNLNNQYTAEARGALARSVADTGDVRGIGQLLRAQAGETAIERTLRQQAEAELALGRSLSAEEMRDATQTARAALGARGLATSMSGTAAEILNRDQYAQARESTRRNFAAATNQMVTGNVTGRYGQAAGVLGNAAQMDLANSTQQMAIDPYQRALGSAGIGSQLGGSLMDSTGRTWANSQQLAGQTASFNANMLDERYNSFMNNQSALRSARMQAGAANNSATMGMVGAGIGAAAGIAVIAI